MREFLKGKKTYIVAFMVAVVIFLHMIGIQIPDEVYVILGALGVSGLRAAISKLPTSNKGKKTYITAGITAILSTLDLLKIVNIPNEIYGALITLAGVFLRIGIKKAE